MSIYNILNSLALEQPDCFGVEVKCAEQLFSQALRDRQARIAGAAAFLGRSFEMARDEASYAGVAPPRILDHPQISLVGDVDKFMVEQFLDRLHDAQREGGGDIAVELTTVGGDPEMARRIL